MDVQRACHPRPPLRHSRHRRPHSPIIGFAVEPAGIDGIAAFRMCVPADSGTGLARYLDCDHDPLVQFHRSPTSLRCPDTAQIKSIP